MIVPGPLARGSLPVTSIFLLVAALVIPTLLRLPSFFEPHWYGDEGIFAAVARQLLAGDVLYADIWDHKPPLIFAVYGAAIALFGESIVALRALATGAVLLTQLQIFRAARCFVTPGLAAVAAACAGLVLAIPTLEGTLALTEVFMIALTTTAMASYLAATRSDTGPAKRDLFLIGLTLGLASCFKPVAGLDLLALLAFITLSSSVRGVGPTVAGFTAPWLFFAAVFAARGALPEFVEANFLYQLDYVRGGSPGVASMAFLVVPPVAALLYATRSGAARNPSTLVVLWLAFALSGAALAPQAHAHYLIQVVPPACLAAVLLAGEPRKLAMPVLPLAAAVALMIHSVFGLTNGLTLNSAFDYYQAAGRSIREGTTDPFTNQYWSWHRTDTMLKALSTQPSDTTEVLLWGEQPWVYGLGDVEPVGRFVVWYHVHGDESREAEVLNALREAPSAIVLIESGVPRFDALESMLATTYTCEEADDVSVCVNTATLEPELSQDETSDGD